MIRTSGSLAFVTVVFVALTSGCNGDDPSGGGGSGATAGGIAGNTGASIDVPEFNPDADIVAGTIWHVATNGDDATNDGSENKPWATVARAFEAVSPGDAVALHEGTYHERIAVTTSGQPGKYIAIIAWNGAPVTIDGANVDLEAVHVGNWVRGLVHVADAAYVRISGLAVNNSADNAIAVTRADHVVIDNCSTYDSHSSGIGVWSSNDVTVRGNRVQLACNNGNQECVTVAGTSNNISVIKNEISRGGPGDNGGEGIDIKGGGHVAQAPNGLPQGPSNVYVVSNSVHDINRVCLYTDAWDADVGPVVFAGNEVYNCRGTSMAAAGESGGRLHDVLFANNLIYRTMDKPADFGGAGLAFAYDWGNALPTLENVAAVNNTFYNVGWSCASIDYSGNFPGKTSELHFVNNICALSAGPIVATDDNDNQDLAIESLDVSHNLLWFVNPNYSAAEYYTDPVFHGPNATIGNPAFAGDLTGSSLVASDFQLLLQSPAIGAGVDSPFVPDTDFAGSVRDHQSVTLGAYAAPK